MGAVVIVIGLLLLVTAWWFLPAWLLPLPKDLPGKERIELANDLRRTCAPILGGVLVLLGLYLTYRRIEVTEEGQITERFTRAIEHLGQSRLEMKLGGIYALERIARDSVRDRLPIIEVLTAYVRENSPLEEPPAKMKTKMTPGGERIAPKQDIQAVLTVLGRLLQIFDLGDRAHLDLRNTDLRGIQLVRASLNGINLDNASLEQSMLFEVCLKNSLIRCTSFRESFLAAVNFENASLVEVDFRGCNFIAPQFKKARFSKTNFRGANLVSARDLTLGQLESVLYDDETKFPKELAATLKVRPTSTVPGDPP